MKRKIADHYQMIFEDGRIRFRNRQTTLFEIWNDEESEEGIDAPSVFRGE